MAQQQSADRTDPQAPNRASSVEQAEGSRESADTSTDSQSNAPHPQQSAGITNRPLDQEQHEQASLPPRGRAKEGGHA